MIAALKNNKSLTFYQFPSDFRLKKNSNYVGGISSFSIANTSVEAQLQERFITDAFSQLKSDVINRGKIYASNSVASRGGYMAEEFVAGSYNLDATIKKVDTHRAVTDKSTGRASADITYGDKRASLKFNKCAKNSAKNQLNPEYGDQIRIVPKDQLPESKKILKNLANDNRRKGRSDVAIQQDAVGNLLDDRIRGDRGVESTPLTKEQDLDLARAISRDRDGNIIVDKSKIDKVMQDTGITKKVKTAKFRNQIRGLGIAVSIGVGIGATISIITTLAQSGVTPDTIKLAATEGLKSGTESGILAATGYCIGQIASMAVSGVLENAGITLSGNVYQMVNMGIAGLLTIGAFSIYQFMRLKLQGLTTQNALLKIGKQVLFSLSTLAVSILAQVIWEGAAGIIVSAGIGILIITYSVADSVHQRDIGEKIRIYTIEKCYPTF